MKKKILIPIIAGVLALATFAGCSSAGTTSSPERNHNGNGAVSYEAAGEVYSDDVSNKSYIMADAVEYEYGYEVNMDAGSMTNNGAGISNEVTVDPAQGRLLIRTVSITAETKEFSNVKTDLEAQVKALGGYIESSSVSGTGDNKNLRTAYYTVRVPADQLDSLIDLVGNSCTVISSSESTSDVTLEYVDTQARLESLRVEYEQLLELLDQAEDLDTIIVLQDRLTDVRYDIESSESRLRTLENQVLFATLNLTVKEVLEETEVEEPHVITFGERVGNQFQDMWDNTVEFFQDLLLGLIASIPGLIVLAVIIIVSLIVFFSIRKKRRNRRAKALAEKEAAAKKAEASKEEESTEKNEDKKEEGKE